MDLDRTIYSFSELGNLIINNLNTEGLDSIIGAASMANAWFSPACSNYALKNIAEKFLDEDNLRKWMAHYQKPLPSSEKTVAIIMAGNIPLAGWHDLMCVLISGHKAQIKLSSKDEVLPKYLIDRLISIDNAFDGKIEIVDKLHTFDAVIATGSNNTSRYFEYYFGKYPHIIRKGRNSVAILSGQESQRQLFIMGMDIFSYFGLGCRNVSKLYVPKDYDFIPLLDALSQYSKVSDFFKYDNNYTYHKSIMLINQVKHYDTGFLLLKEDKSLASAVACLHYEYYPDEKELKAVIDSQREAIQCIVGDINQGIADTGYGKSQQPELWDYADKVDTMQFLLGLS